MSSEMHRARLWLGGLAAGVAGSLVAALAGSVGTAMAATAIEAPGDAAEVSRGGGSAASVIPAPARVTLGRGTFALAKGAAIYVNSSAERPAAQFLVDTLARTSAIRLSVREVGGRTGETQLAKAPAGQIVFETRPSAASPEAYELEVSPQQVRIVANDPRGLFYGGVTLWQLFTAKPNAQATGKSAPTLPAMRISDTPRFAWRGFMLDSARHFQSVAFIKTLLDEMALHKLNTFQWHLTDDQGWRLQIRRYPRLTEIGAWRVPAGAAPAADIDPATGKPRLYGGFYTQEEVRDVVAYAAARHITVVPEIELPGHAQAAIAAYPELGTEGPTPPPSSEWGVHTYLFNVDESTFTFLENVLTEVMELFPSAYIHTGGDEAAKDRWRVSPRVQARMRELNVANEAALQGYFTHRIERFLSAHGRKLIGWDEILDGGVPPSATVMSWRGTDGAIVASAQGHDVVMSPSPNLYLDYLQSAAADEPPGRPTYVTLADMYSYNLLPEKITGGAAKHVIGAQVNAWTEHMRTTSRVEHALFPRLAAFAENVWSPPEQRDWYGFVHRLPAQFARYEKLGIEPADSAFAVSFALSEAAGGGVQLALANQASLGEIRYTVDGSLPTVNSNRYTRPLALAMAQTVRASTFLDGRRISKPRAQRVDRPALLSRNDDQLKSCSNKLPLRLEDDAPRDGARAVFNVDILDPCWQWPSANLDSVRAISVSVGQVPYNFQVGDAVNHIPLFAPQSAAGELEVWLDSCEGERVAVLPLAPASGNNAVTALRETTLKLSDAQRARGVVRDLCLRFTRRGVDPIWAIKSVQLVESARE